MRKGVALKPLPKIRMGEANQRLCPLGHRFAFEIHPALLGHDIHAVRAGRGDDIALREVHHDPALARTLSFIG